MTENNWSDWTPVQMEALRASELNYRRLFEASQDGILILEAETGRICDVNPFLTAMLGFSHGELVGTPIWELGPFRDIVANKAKFDQLKGQGYARYENLGIETKDKRMIAVEFVSNVYQAGDHNVIQCNVRDITLRSEAEKQRSRIAMIVEYSGAAIVSKTMDGIVIGWNRGAEIQYGYTAEEIIGHPISILFASGRHEEYLEIMKKVRNGETVPAFDTVRQRKDGTSINVSLGISPILARDGSVVGASQSSHDITRLKKLEAQFIESQKMEVVGQLAAGVAHDFNNILSVIMCYTELLAAEFPAEGRLHGYVEQIAHASERAVGLTKQLLVFSHRETVRPTVLDLNKVVMEMDKMLARLIHENIEMKIVPGVQTGRIQADSGYIGQLLMNLVVNARDAMPKGGKLSIATTNVALDRNQLAAHPAASPGNYVMLSVSDTGVGMSDEVKAHLFEPFFTTKPAGKGTGLGLATCQTVVQQSGGHIDVYSEPCEGTTFKVYFPRVDQPLSEGNAPGVRASDLPRGSEALLVVEDDPALRSLACSVLKGQGYEVLSASNGRDALRVAREHKGARIRLVITDVIMPLMGGKVMAEWFKHTSPGLKILFTSGYTNDAIAQHGALDTGVEFLPKPYSRALLSRRVRELLDQPDLGQSQLVSETPRDA